jgi:toxin-antitoxin system PIN domain toxin
MILPDVNVLVNALRSDATDHRLCRSWLDGVVNGESRYGMSPQVLAAVVRVATHTRVFKQPSTLKEALGFADVLLGQSHCVVVQPGESHWEIFDRLCREADARGNLVADAWFAAMAIEAGCEWVTLDRDYARFRGLKWSVPASS